MNSFNNTFYKFCSNDNKLNKRFSINRNFIVKLKYNSNTVHYFICRQEFCNFYKDFYILIQNSSNL